jgi:DNA mismatch repair ATPase MutS
LGFGLRHSASLHTYMSLRNSNSSGRRHTTLHVHVAAQLLTDSSTAEKRAHKELLTDLSLLLAHTHETPCLQVCATKKVCRYHPTEVKAGMAALARAQEQLQAACGVAWVQLLRDFTAAHHAAFRAAVAAVAQLDALHGLAVVASGPGYCRPQVCAGHSIHIGREWVNALRGGGGAAGGISCKA